MMKKLTLPPVLLLLLLFNGCAQKEQIKLIPIPPAPTFTLRYVALDKNVSMEKHDFRKLIRNYKKNKRIIKILNKQIIDFNERPP
jgi:uncharacterized lipoprotein YajG